MKTVTIREAKAKLNELIVLAEKGEDVVFLRGSKIVACIKPATEDDYEASHELTDEQAERIWQQVREERRAGKGLSFRSAEEAVKYLRNWKPKA